MAGRFRRFVAARIQGLFPTPRVLPDYAPSAFSVLADEAGEYTEQRAATLAPVLGGIHLIARNAAASSWTVEMYDGARRSWKPVRMEGWPAWAHPAKGPHPTQTLPVAIETWILSRLIGSNSYVVPTVTVGSEVREWFVPPAAYVYAYETGSYREPVGYTYGGKKFMQARTGKAPRLNEILHTPTLLINSQLIGTSAFAKAAPSFRAGIKADAHAEQVHESGGMQAGVLSTGNSEYGNEQQYHDFANTIYRNMRDPRRRGAPIVVPGDVRSVPLYTTPQDSQLVDARSLTWSAASAIMTIPPSILGNPNSTTWGSGTRAQMDLFRAFTLAGHLTALNDTFSRLLPLNWRFRLTPEHLQWQADPLGAARYTARLTDKVITVNEARAVVGYEPLEDERADTLPFKMLPVADNGAPVADNGGDSDSGRDDGNTNETTEQQMEEADEPREREAGLVEETTMKARREFTSEASVLHAGAQAMKVDDTAAGDEDTDIMSISGTAIRFGELGVPTNGLGEQVPMIIQHGALDDTDLSDVFLLIQHSPYEMIARGATGDVKVTVGDDAVSWSAMLDRNDPDAMGVYYKVKRGTFRSCSMGYSVMESEERTDKTTGEDVTLVSKLRLHEISVVPDGAFPGSDSVAASADAADVCGEREVFTAEEISARFIPRQEKSTEAMATVDDNDKSAAVLSFDSLLYPVDRRL